MPEIASAQIERDENGCPFCPAFGDIYASRSGASQQAQYVFIKGNGLPERWQGKDRFVILENGFGLGTNFLNTLLVWRSDPKRSKTLHYVSIEKFPVTAGQLTEFADPCVQSLAAELAAQWPILTPGVHQLFFDEGRVVLTLYFMDSLRASKQLSLQFDALYLDGFSPAKNPEMWEKRLLTGLCKHAGKDATLATWCVSGAVRQSLSQTGFEVKKTVGFGKKREMTIGVYSPKFLHARKRSLQLALSSDQERSVLVIGAGLAGSAVAAEFSRRQWQVTVIDSGFVAGSGASAIRYGIAHAQPATDDNLLFRASRSGFLEAVRALKAYPNLFDSRGLFQMAKNDAEYAKWQSWFEGKGAFDIPSDFIRLMSADEASARLGMRVRRGGLFHEGAGAVAVNRWVRERLERSKATFLSNQTVARIEKQADGRWTAFSEEGMPLASASVCVLCTAYQTASLLGYSLSCEQWQGRISLLRDTDLPRLQGALTGPGYVIRSADDWVGVGATYERLGQELSYEQAHDHNLAHLQDFFPQLKSAVAAGFYCGRRCVSADRLPLIGAAADRALMPERSEALSAVPRQPGLFISAAMGSRGVVFSDIGARIIASYVEGEPLPVEQDLADALDPARFLLNDRC